MTPNELLKQLSSHEQECDALGTLWKSVINSSCPDERQLCIWLGLHDFNTVVWGIREEATAYQRSNRQMTSDHLLRYVSKAMNARKARMQSTGQAA